MTPDCKYCKIAQVIKMNESISKVNHSLRYESQDRFNQALLYDFYGELLTDHQKNIYEQSVLEDLSLSEIAEDEGISRQGVHDLVKRCNKSLMGYEEKLHLVEKFLSIKKKLQDMNGLLDAEEQNRISTEELIKHIRKISSEITEEL